MELENLGRGLIFIFVFIGGAGNAGGIQSLRDPIQCIPTLNVIPLHRTPSPEKDSGTLGEIVPVLFVGDASMMLHKVVIVLYVRHLF